jgi:hypothetical protein
MNRKNYFFVGCFLIAMLINANYAGAQIWHNSGANISGVVLNPKIVISNDTAFIAYGNMSTNMVEFRKQVGNTWQLLGQYSARDYAFDLELSQTGAPLLAYVSAQLVSGNLNFSLEVMRYQNGAVSNYDFTSLGSGPNTNNTVDIFDFEVHPAINGAHGVIFRFNNSYQTIYKGKIGGPSGPMWSDSYFVLAVGGNSGVKNAQLVYNTTDLDAFIVSRNETSFGGTVNALVGHIFRHSAAEAAPSEIVDPFIQSSNVIDQYIELVAYNNEVYAVLTSSGAATIYKFLISSMGSVSFNTFYGLGTTKLEPKINVDSDGNFYVSYVEEVGSTYPGKVSVFDETFTTETLLGGTNYNDLGNMVGNWSLALNGTDAYVFFSYGPPFNNAKVRKFGCPNAPTLSLNETTGVLSAPNAVAGGSYSWINCDTQAEVATTVTYTPTQTGLYGLIITYNNCVVNADCIQVTIGGGGSVNIEEDQLSNISIYPNPAASVFYLNNLELNTDVMLVDQLGKVVYQTVSQNETIQIPIVDFQSGVYFVKLLTPGGSAITKRVAIVH